ncbi:hypothetical protein Ciccas_003847 [Cichlidogyrus casuarinus]|uniref:C2H2-type domain-containing protein n=1 Tax=Cichlidogyrus casuarinus TaxID=1844966 RepID=A0ABD2QD70_9PLAT
MAAIPQFPNFVIKRFNKEEISIPPEQLPRFNSNTDKSKALYKCPYPSCGLRYRYNLLLKHLVLYHKENLDHMPAPLEDNSKRPVMPPPSKEMIKHDPAFIDWLQSVQQHADILRHGKRDSDLKRNSTASSLHPKETIRLHRIVRYTIYFYSLNLQSSDSDFHMIKPPLISLVKGPSSGFSSHDRLISSEPCHSFDENCESLNMSNLVATELVG